MKRVSSILRQILLLSIATAPYAWVAAASADAGNIEPAAFTLLHEMTGTWSVKEWMWEGPGAPPISLPDAEARRKLIGNQFVQEVMTVPAPDSKDAFIRISYFGYNAVNRKYEYFSIDTRAPQMMNERSFDAPRAASGPIDLRGGTFVAPKWGARVNAAFRYRLVVGPVHDNRQEVQLFLTPLSSGNEQEFLAFKYAYSRRRRVAM